MNVSQDYTRDEKAKAALRSQGYPLSRFLQMNSEEKDALAQANGNSRKTIQMIVEANNERLKASDECTDDVADVVVNDEWA